MIYECWRPEAGSRRPEARGWKLEAGPDRTGPEAGLDQTRLEAGSRNILYSIVDSILYRLYSIQYCITNK